MNFLSHFYFDRNTDNCYYIIGTVLPDLLKNADKTIVLHPENLVHTNEDVNDIVKGWNKHLEVDRYFHSSQFFAHHSHELKKMLLPAIAGSPVKPFFLGHVALELILDNLLVTNQKITIDSFYNHLDGCEDDRIRDFLIFAGLKETSIFFKFYHGFKNSRYLYSYAETKEIAYALKRICMRVWINPFTAAQEATMGSVLLSYREILLNEYMTIFNEIGERLYISLKKQIQ